MATDTFSNREEAHTCTWTHTHKAQSNFHLLTWSFIRSFIHFSPPVSLWGLLWRQLASSSITHLCVDTVPAALVLLLTHTMQFFKASQQHDVGYDRKISEKAAAIPSSFSNRSCKNEVISVPHPLLYFYCCFEFLMGFAEHRAALIDWFLQVS